MQLTHLVMFKFWSGATPTTADIPDIPGIEGKVADHRLHGKVTDHRLHGKVTDHRMHGKAEER